MNSRSANPKVRLLFAAIALVFIALAVTGAVRWYSPVPFWDMWNGYLGFYVHIMDGDWSAWWAQHNEHRIVLARLFFWMDLAWFRGQGWFLLIVNYVLIGCTCLVFWKIWQERSHGKYTYIALFLTAWLFSWSQHQNLAWGFQSQFIFAQLLPLTALYCLHLSTASKTRSALIFSCATGFGVLSVGSMANGILALPVMTLYALIVGMKWQRSLLLAVLSVVTIWLYFHNYNGDDGRVARTLLEKPGQVIHFLLLYIGGPFYYMSDHAATGNLLAMLAGTFFIASCCVLTWQILPRARQATLPLAVLMFILYIGASALAVAGSRLIFGADYALQSRYMTPALMAWGALLVLYAPALEALDHRLKGKSWMLFLLLVMAMLSMQLRALDSQRSRLFSREIGALALELNINDQHEIRHIWWVAKTAISAAKEPRKRELSIFGLPPFKEAGAAMNRKLSATSSARQCRGNIEAIRTIKRERHYVAVRGWIYDPEHYSVPESLRLVDRHGIVKGVALTGARRKDVAKALGRAAKYSGFSGYVSREIEGEPVEVVDPESGCRFSAQVPMSIFHVSKAPAKVQSVNVSADQIVPGNEWTGSDFQHSTLAGLAVFGSFIHADSDTGVLTLKMKRGGKLLYRSGPTGGHQTITLIDAKQTVILPVALQWVQLNFSNDSLPKTFTLQFADNGAHWGEWSAIALRKAKQAR